MQVVVCINRIPDPEAPWLGVKLNESSTAPVLEHIGLVVGPFDENAIEVALQFKDAAGARVTALALGPASHEDALRRALAVRCDAAVHVREDRAGELDSAGTARLLGAAIRKLANVDLVLCGRQVGDWDGGQVGQLLAEELGFSCLTLARRIESVTTEAVRLSREVAEGVALVEVSLPAVATVTNTAENKLRIAKVKDAMAARRAPITNWTVADLGDLPCDPLGDGGSVVVDRVFFLEMETKVRMLDTADPQAAADHLARYIVGLKLPSTIQGEAGGNG